MPCFLIPDHLSQIKDLQKEVLDHLKIKGMENFIIPRTPAYFEKHLCTPHAITGLFDDERLMAQAIFHVQESGIADYTRLSTLPSQKPDERISIIKGALVHPDYQGQGHFKTLISTFLDWAADNDIHHALSRVETTHAASIKTFEKNGFVRVNTITDARDDAHVHVMHKRV